MSSANARVFHTLTLRRLALTGLFVCFGGGLLGVSAHKWLSRSSAALMQTPQKREPVQVVRFTLYDDGIWPAEARVGNGLIALQLEDNTRGSDGLTIARETGDGKTVEVIGRFLRLGKVARTRDEIKLPPGIYQIADVSQPKHTARLIVTTEKVGALN